VPVGLPPPHRHGRGEWCPQPAHRVRSRLDALFLNGRAIRGPASHRDSACGQSSSSILPIGRIVPTVASHRLTKDELKLGRTLLDAILSRGTAAFDSEYSAAGLSSDHARRADLITLALAVCYLCLNLRLPRRTSKRQDYEALLVRTAAPQFEQAIEPDLAAELLMYACKLGSAPERRNTDQVARTYLAVTAAALEYSTRHSLREWYGRYNTLASIVRRRTVIPDDAREPG
jgi:hypothetical protein